MYQEPKLNEYLVEDKSSETTAQVNEASEVSGS